MDHKKTLIEIKQQQRLTLEQQIEKLRNEVSELRHEVFELGNQIDVSMEFQKYVLEAIGCKEEAARLARKMEEMHQARIDAYNRERDTIPPPDSSDV